MVDKFRDAEDRLLESLFESEPIADDGFSDRVVGRIRRQIWVRRLALPLAMLVGGAIAIKPASQLVAAGLALISAVPMDLVAAPAAMIPQLPLILLGGTLLAIGMLTFRMLEE